MTSMIKDVSLLHKVNETIFCTIKQNWEPLILIYFYETKKTQFTTANNIRGKHIFELVLIQLNLLIVNKKYVVKKNVY